MRSFGGNASAVRRSTLPDGTPTVLKRLAPPREGVPSFGPPPSSVPSSIAYWRRELDFYSSRWSSAANLRAPSLLQVDEHPDGALSLHLEYVPDVTNPTWCALELSTAARQLALFNMTHLGRVDDAPSWMSRSFLRTWFVMVTRPVIDVLGSTWQRGIGSVGPRPAADVVGALWARRREVCARLEVLPTTLCHLDPHRGNLRVAADGTVTAVDWAYVGVEVLGSDCAQLFASSAARLMIPADRLDEHWEAICEAYIEGLADAGCDGPTRDGVRASITLAMCLRWGAGHLFWLPHLTSSRPMLEERWWGRPFEEVEDDLVAVSSFLLALTVRQLDG